MSKIAEALKEKQETCAFRKVFLSLNDEDQAAVGEAITNGISSSAISTAIRAGGYKMGHQTITDHRNWFCKCSKANK